MANNIWGSLLSKLKKDGVLHFSLIDPDPLKQSCEDAATIAYLAEKSGTDAIMVGGSTVIECDSTVKAIKKKVNIPIILFPGDLTGISRYADAIFFMSLLNSVNPRYIIGAQAAAAPIIRSMELEPIPMAYLIIEPGGTAGYVGYAQLIPRTKPKIAVSYAIAAELIGYKVIYLEAGSGAGQAVPLDTISMVSKAVNVPVIVGGGLNTIEDAVNAVKAGADIIVQGTIIEKTILKDKGEKLKETIQAIKKC
ncbi:MAG: geranylgeranylglyceryl/heptaprenylglyceryl phosphate synthase [Candidatus Odinarchaeia archaeon]